MTVKKNMFENDRGLKGEYLKEFLMAFDYSILETEAVTRGYAKDYAMPNPPIRMAEVEILNKIAEGVARHINQAGGLDYASLDAMQLEPIITDVLFAVRCSFPEEEGGSDLETERVIDEDTPVADEEIISDAEVLSYFLGLGDDIREIYNECHALQHGLQDSYITQYVCKRPVYVFQGFDPIDIYACEYLGQSFLAEKPVRGKNLRDVFRAAKIDALKDGLIELLRREDASLSAEDLQHRMREKLQEISDQFQIPLPQNF